MAVGSNANYLDSVHTGLTYTGIHSDLELIDLPSVTLADLTAITLTASDGSNFTNTTVPPMRPPRGRPPNLSGEVRIPLYSLIFLLSVIGNTLVIVTLAQNRRMRTVTNVFLLNLSISDLLLAVFCMPFTLIPTLLRNFIFGKTMCVLIRYLQGVTVGVNVFTLVSISLERYFAICQPLRSRAWQTLSHSYKMIGGVWCLSLILMLPIAIFQKLLAMPHGGHKCMEEWPDLWYQQGYTLALDLLLLVVPLLLMLVAYGKIAWTLYEGMKPEIRGVQGTEEMTGLRQKSYDEEEANSDELEHRMGRNTSSYANGTSSARNGKRNSKPANNGITLRQQQQRYRPPIRQSNTEKLLAAKRRVIKMLLVVVVEFFVFWTPVYVLQTWLALDPQSAFTHVTPMTMNLIHLLSYVSSCCNPITYCFMNRKFRQGFLSAFRCCGPSYWRRGRRPPHWTGADQSYVGAGNTCGQSQRTGINGAGLTLAEGLDNACDTESVLNHTGNVVTEQREATTRLMPTEWFRSKNHNYPCQL